MDAKRDIAITPEELEELRQQMQGCTPCLEFVESLKTTVKLCHELELDAAPSPLETEAKRQIQSAWQSMLAKRQRARAESA